MDTLADVVETGRDREGRVLDSPERSTPYSYGEFCTNACKAGNLLRHYGVHPGSELAVLVGPKEPGPTDEPGRLAAAGDPLLALLGGALVGARVDLTPTEPIEARALVGPAAWLEEVDVTAGCSRLAYGGPPDDPNVAHFERELWSENPVAPPESPASDDPALLVGDDAFTQGGLVDAALETAEEYEFDDEMGVGLDAPLKTVGAVVAGVLAPLASGATIVPLPVDADPDAPETDLDVVVSSDYDGPVSSIDPDSVSVEPDTRRA